MKILLIGLTALLLLDGCVKRPAGVNYVVGLECHPTLRLIDCTSDQEPPICKRMSAKFDKGCERLVAK